MAIQWDPKLAVGVPIVDEQHQELFARVNALLDAMMHKRGKEEIGHLVEFLQAYVVEHFGAEVKLMQRSGYPDRAAHERQHAEFVKTFLESKAELEKGGPTYALTIKLNNYLTTWLVQHIGSTDKKLGEYLRTHPGPQQVA